MDDPLRSAAVIRRIKVGIKDAGAAELKLDPGALADLEGGLAEALAELAGGHAQQVAADVRRGLDWRGGPRNGGRLDRRARRAGGDGKQGEEK